MYNCRVCKSNTLEFIQMKKERRLIETQRGICKECATEYERLRLARSKAEYSPEAHLTCDDCDRVFSIHRNGSNRSRLRTNCPFCKSENIERY